MTKRVLGHLLIAVAASRRRVLLMAMLVAVGLVASANAPSASAGTGGGSKTERRHPPVWVRGGYVNDLQGCSPAPGPSPYLLTLECWGGSVWDGGWSGHTIIHLIATVDMAGRFAGTYQEWFTGTYLGDNSYGGIHTRGHFSIDENNQFIAQAKIVGGSCGFAGSSGSVAYDGNSVHGGFVGEWFRPPTKPGPATCVPERPSPLTPPK
jgi:hypothetical protein